MPSHFGIRSLVVLMGKPIPACIFENDLLLPGWDSFLQGNIMKPENLP